MHTVTIGGEDYNLDDDRLDESALCDAALEFINFSAEWPQDALETKISGTGWLCVRPRTSQDWVVLGERPVLVNF